MIQEVNFGMRTSIISHTKIREPLPDVLQIKIFWVQIELCDVF